MDDFSSDMQFTTIYLKVDALIPEERDYLHYCKLMKVSNHIDRFSAPGGLAHEDVQQMVTRDCVNRSSQCGTGKRKEIK